LPTEIIEVIDVGFSSNPQLIGGKFMRGPCPYDLGNPTTDVCQEVMASIVLDLSKSDNNTPLQLYVMYLAAMDRAIFDGELGVALQEVNPNAPAEIASGQESQGGFPPTEPPTNGPTMTATADEDTSRGLSGTIILGISAGGVLFVIVSWHILSSQRKYERRIKQKKETARKLRDKALQKNNDDPEAARDTQEYDSNYHGDVGVSKEQQFSKKFSRGNEQKPLTDGEVSTVDASTVSTVTDDAAHTKPHQSNLGQQLVDEEKRPEEEGEDDYEDTAGYVEDGPAAMLAATVPYINSPPRDKGKVDLQPRIEIEGSEHVVAYGAHIPTESRSIGNISHESEAGWSEAYTSSIGSVSDDDLLLDPPCIIPTTAQQMVSISPTSPLVQSSPKRQRASAEEKFEELECAIVAGDWAAVGSTAAAMANMVDSQSKSEISKSTITGASGMSSSHSQSWKNKIDSEKADQLSKLIEQGDWEGIVLAAATFEAEASGAYNSYTLQNTNVTSSDGSIDELMVHEDDTDDEESDRDYIYPEASESSLRSSRSNVSRDRIRAEIAALVEEVVPEELDHVDEMLEQFAGRENDLLETLATMQERAHSMSSANKRSAKSLFKGQL
jgi:hypothetical protein